MKFTLTPLELKAYKFCLIWIEKSRKFFPNYKHVELKSGDPRKSLMFKYCYKCIRETLLDENDFDLYIRAQLDILRSISNNGGQVLIDPSCLVGDKAWKRWKLWKKKYDKIKKNPIEISENIDTQKIINTLETTKEFFNTKLGENPQIEKYKEIYINQNIFRWINFGKISSYYLAISPFIKQIFTPEDFKKINFDEKLYEINEEIIKKFKELFKNEYL